MLQNRRKHQVKVRSIVGVHESLGVIIESPTTISLKNNVGDAGNAETDKTNEKKYSFDDCFVVKDKDVNGTL